MSVAKNLLNMEEAFQVSARMFADVSSNEEIAAETHAIILASERQKRGPLYLRVMWLAVMGDAAMANLPIVGSTAKDGPNPDKYPYEGQGEKGVEPKTGSRYTDAAWLQPDGVKIKAELALIKAAKDGQADAANPYSVMNSGDLDREKNKQLGRFNTLKKQIVAMVKLDKQIRAMEDFKFIDLEIATERDITSGDDVPSSAKEPLTLAHKQHRNDFRIISIADFTALKLGLVKLDCNSVATLINTCTPKKGSGKDNKKQASDDKTVKPFTLNTIEQAVAEFAAFVSAKDKDERLKNQAVIRKRSNETDADDYNLSLGNVYMFLATMWEAGLDVKYHKALDRMDDGEKTEGDRKSLIALSQKHIAKTA